MIQGKRLTITSSTALLLLLGGCADPAARLWSKPGVSDDRRDADYRECRGDTRQAWSGGIDQDVAASRQANSPFVSPIDQPGTLPYRDTERGDRALDGCMIAHGYKHE